MSGFRLGLLVALVAALVGLSLMVAKSAGSSVGNVLDSYRGVSVHDNGPLIVVSHGKSNGPDGYYYGKKWQCVEFVKRFYREALGHDMPDGWGHAKSFFDESVPDGACNLRRGLLQFSNGSTSPPRPDDLMVFQGSLGHVAIVTVVDEDSVELIQQNVPGTPRDRYELVAEHGRYWVQGPSRPAGWLRKPGGSAAPVRACVGEPPATRTAATEAGDE